jgi:hypothetical protein
MARKEAVGNTRKMTSIPSPTRYHRSLGWHAPAIRRTVIVGAIGLIVAVVRVWFMPWGMAVVGGWDAAALIGMCTRSAIPRCAIAGSGAHSPLMWLGRRRS